MDMDLDNAVQLGSQILFRMSREPAEQMDGRHEESRTPLSVLLLLRFRFPSFLCVLCGFAVQNGSWNMETTNETIKKF